MLVTCRLSKYHPHIAYCCTQGIPPKHITQAEALPTLLTVLTPPGATGAKAEPGTARALHAGQLTLAQSDLVAAAP